MTTNALDRLLNEDRLTVPRMAKEADVNPCTVWRWMTVGARGVKLESFCIGGKRYTTRQAFQRFVAAGTGVSATSTDSRKRSIRAAERALAKAGI
ncbi:MAG: DUF1580 domain-containing protein [Thermoguttaceae bacterium]|nr:DUF1580 domain-containing protein [Thermoguttaceae bacterium]